MVGANASGIRRRVVVAWTVGVVAFTLLYGGWVLFFLGFAVWWNLTDPSGSPWGAGLVAIVALSIPAAALFARRFGMRRGDSWDLLARRMALTSLLVAFAIGSVLGIMAMAATGI